MMTKKKPNAVADAEEVVKVKRQELDAAQAAVRRLQDELGAAMAAARSARVDADAGLPQCKMVRVRWRSSAETDSGSVVILRRTPGGMLVVRRVGDGPGMKWKFKFSAHRGLYVQAEKGSGFSDDHRELRDVPAEFVPAGALASA